MTATELLDGPATAKQLKASIMACGALAEAIREVGEVPAGTLYAACLNVMSLEVFESFISRLVGAGLVNRTSEHLLRWIGPRITE